MKVRIAHEDPGPPILIPKAVLTYLNTDVNCHTVANNFNYTNNSIYNI